MGKIVLTGFSDEIAPQLDAQLEALQAWGISHIELRAADGVNVSDFTPEKTREVKRKLEEAGVSVSSIGSPLGKIGIEEVFEPHMEKLKRTLEIQKELGAPYLRMFSFYIPAGKDPSLYREEVFSRVGAMAEEAGKWDAVLLHENEKRIYGDNAARCLELMREFYGPYFRAVFDFANFVETDQETILAYKALKPYIEYVHIKDALWKEKKVVPAGQGDGHVKKILSDLLDSGFSGFLSLEPHLVDFAGLSSLEADAKKRNAAMDGKTAWKLALDALQAILAELEK